MTADNTIRTFNRNARNYEQKWKDYLSHTHSMFLAHLQTRGNETILDVSGGTGLLADELLKGDLSFSELVVNDPSEGMLALARNRLPDDPAITFTNHPADRLPFERNRFDIILCLNAFHYYTNQPSVLEIFNNILKPGGQLCLLDWNRSGLFRIVNGIIRWWMPEQIDTRSRAELEGMLENAGYRLIISESWYWRYWNFLFVKAEK